MTSDVLEALSDHPLFGIVPRTDLPAVLDDPATRTFAAGEALFRQGEPARRLYLIVRGAVELVVERPGQVPEMLARLSAGEAVGADAILPGCRHAATARAAAPTLAVVVDGARLTTHFEAHFDQAIAIIGEMAGSLRGQIKEITELKLQSTTERLAGYLLELAGEARGRAAVRLPFEKRMLADRLGMEPATLSRAFAKLREWGVETGRGDRVDIADVAVLRRVAAATDMLGDGGMP
ncbi:MAG: cyclic nucleotide-binding domain-containing protein [Magnetospirillum sp.]|nr:cyclic nucleotide-binding domain-containing protein [Magnetospirillum sp.]